MRSSISVARTTCGVIFCLVGDLGYLKCHLRRFTVWFPCPLPHSKIKTLNGRRFKKLLRSKNCIDGYRTSCLWIQLASV
jgi:hypothetical protein